MKNGGVVGLALTALLPQKFTYLDRPVKLPGFKIVAYTTIITESGLRVALQIASSTTCTCCGDSYFDVTNMMSELIEAGFKYVPVGISSDLPLLELPRNTVVFLRSHKESNGLGNYLLCDESGHRPIPLAKYSKVHCPEHEQLTVIVDSKIPTGIFEQKDIAAVA